MAKKMQQTHIKSFMGNSQFIFSSRYMAGAATNPDPEVFAFAVAQLKAVFDL